MATCGVRAIILLIALFSIVAAEWPIDNEPYGFLGCKQLRFRGYWENDIDSSHLDESTDGICISVALANIAVYYRWPKVSRFDGVFLNNDGDGFTKRIDHRWQYSLITGTNGRPGTADCGTDDPGSRYLGDDESWTGGNEIRKLIYAVERSYGYDHGWFRTLDTADCNGGGYYAVEHVLRNRFGYPGAMTIKANVPESRTRVVQELKRGMPVVAMKCDHIYLLDGHKVDTKKGGRDLIHSSDYLQGDASMGWFPWKYFYNEGLEHFVVGIEPRYRVPASPSSSTITYYWGKGYIPGTAHTQRLGRLSIYRSNKYPIGNISIDLKAKDMSEYTNEHTGPVYRFSRNVRTNYIVIPETGYFKFGIGDATEVTLAIANKDPYAKDLRIVFHDFVASLPTARAVPAK